MIDTRTIKNFLHDPGLMGTDGQQLANEFYPELKKMAAAHFRNERNDHTLCPTDVISEAYIRLYNMKKLEWIDKPHFLALCSQQMRRVLVDYARKRNAHKRGSGITLLTLYEEQTPETGTNMDVLALDDALQKLGKQSTLLENIVAYRYFGGMTNAQIAKVTQTSLSTVKRNLAKALTLLVSYLKDE